MLKLISKFLSWLNGEKPVKKKTVKKKKKVVKKKK